MLTPIVGRIGRQTVFICLASVDEFAVVLGKAVLAPAGAAAGGQADAEIL
jgi:hypothetical protein